MSFDQRLWSSTESTERPMILTPRLSNSGLIFAIVPSSVVQTGVKSLGWEKRIAQELPIHWWKSISPSVVCALKLGASSPIRILKPPVSCRGRRSYHPKVARASRSIEVQVHTEAFFRVVQDYASYPEFVPEVKGVRLGPREGGAVEVTYLLDVKLKIFEFTLRHEPRGPMRIEWQLVRGGDFMRRNLGSWTFERTKSG